MAELKITTGGRERVRNAAEVLSKAFEEDPTLTFLLNSMDKKQRLAYLPKYFRILLSAAAMNHASFEEVDDWASCGVLVPPGCKIDSPLTMLRAGFLSALWSLGIGGIKYLQRALSDLTPVTNACKAKAMKNDKSYYYVFFLGTRQDARGRGLCSKIIKHYQSIAANEKLPIYMEAATEYCWKLYKRLGFVTVDELIIAKGKAAADGTQCQGGPGVKIWGMAWRPTELPLSNGTN